MSTDLTPFLCIEALNTRPSPWLGSMGRSVVGDAVRVDRDALASMFRSGPRFGRTVLLLGVGNPFWHIVCDIDFKLKRVIYVRGNVHFAGWCHDAEICVL
jgi:hypothetical protein